MKIMVADALNNPAYGSGMNPDGTIGKHVYISQQPGEDPRPPDRRGKDYLPLREAC